MSIETTARQQQAPGRKRQPAVSEQRTKAAILDAVIGANPEELGYDE